MTTTLPDAVSEAIVSLNTGADRYVSLHTADPGKTGASETTIVPRVLVATSGGWTAAAADVSTGGRKQTNANDLDFGTASGGATLTHAGLWTALTGGTFKGGAPLTSSQVVASGNPVKALAGTIEIVGAGA